MGGVAQHIPHPHVPHGGQPGVQRHRGHSKRHRKGESRGVSIVFLVLSVGVIFLRGCLLPLPPRTNSRRHGNIMVCTVDTSELRRLVSQERRERAINSRRPHPKPPKNPSHSHNFLHHSSDGRSSGAGDHDPEVAGRKTLVSLRLRHVHGRFEAVVLPVAFHARRRGV